MKISSICHIFVLLLCVGLYISLANFSIADTVYVDISNNTGIEDGSSSHPYSSINTAISYNNSNNSPLNIMINEGTYNESIMLDYSYNSTLPKSIRFINNSSNGKVTFTTNNSFGTLINICALDVISDVNIIIKGIEMIYTHAAIGISSFHYGNINILDCKFKNSCTNQNATAISIWDACNNPKNGTLNIYNNIFTVDNSVTNGLPYTSEKYINIYDTEYTASRAIKVYNNIFIAGNYVSISVQDASAMIYNNTFIQPNIALRAENFTQTSKYECVIFCNNIVFIPKQYCIKHQYVVYPVVLSMNNNIFTRKQNNYISPVSGSTVYNANNIDEFPKFVNMYHNDYRLKPGSPCIDTGLSYFNQPDQDGTPTDMGAYGGKTPMKNWF